MTCWILVGTIPAGGLVMQGARPSAEIVLIQSLRGLFSICETLLGYRSVVEEILSQKEELLHM